MAQARTTTYTCDHCGKKVAKKKDLRRFGVHDVPWRTSVSFDTCSDCETEFLALVAPFTVDDDVSELVRS